MVVQADNFNENASTILVCPLTTEITERLPLRPIVPAGAQTGLRQRSQIMTDKVLALRSDRLCGTLGSIDTAARHQLDRALLVLLDLAR